MQFPHNLSGANANGVNVSSNVSSSFLLKAGLAQNLKGGVIMDVVSFDLL